MRGPGIEDEVAVEEPLEIRVDGAALAVTMRTPGHDEELALGFLHGEGLIDSARAGGADRRPRRQHRRGRRPAARDPGTRSFYTTSSCGVCGKGALEEVAVHAERLPDGPAVARDAARRAARPAAPAGVRAHRRPARDGAVQRGRQLLLVREDVGRHNAMDKVVGRALLDGLLPLHDHVLCVSGRLSFELVQKAAVAGVPVLVGVGAPSSLAVRLADDRNMTLAGFARGGRVNVYTGAERVT